MLCLLHLQCSVSTVNKRRTFSSWQQVLCYKYQYQYQVQQDWYDFSLLWTSPSMVDDAFSVISSYFKGWCCDFFLQMLTDLPVKTFQTVLKRTFLMLYSRDYEGDDDNHPYQSGKSPSSQRRAYTLLSSVCSDWHQTLSHLSSLPTSHWLKCHMNKLKREYMHTVKLFVSSLSTTWFVINALARVSTCKSYRSLTSYNQLPSIRINAYKSGCLGFVAFKKQTLVNLTVHI